MNNGITGPLFKWFGSKWEASRHYPPPRYHKIIEPFAGGAGYSLRHYKRQVLLAESNTLVYRLWDWFINTATAELIREIPINIPEGTDIRTMGLTEGQALLLKHWQRTNNVGECWTVSAWGNGPGQWSRSTRDRIAAEFYLIKHWKLVSRYADETMLIKERQSVCTWFIDPPYQYNYNYRLPVPSYRILAEQIQENCKGQVIVCEARCPKTDAIPDWLPFTEFRSRITSRRGYSKEVVYHREESDYREEYSS